MTTVTSLSNRHGHTSNIDQDKLKECVGQTLSEQSKQQISNILHDVERLSDTEKLLLYLQLPMVIKMKKLIRLNRGVLFYSQNQFEDALSKRRHSVSVPFNYDGRSTRVNSSEKHMNSKRQNEETTCSITLKKRLVDGQNSIGQHEFFDVPGLQTDNAHNHIAGDDTGGSSASLSPSSQSDKTAMQFASNEVGNSQIVQELENHALLDYINSGSPHPNHQPESWESSKLSQLRKLLEKNLPQTGKVALSPATDSPNLQNYTELRQVLLKKNACLAENNAHMSSMSNTGVDDNVQNTYFVETAIDSAEQSVVDSPNCYAEQPVYGLEEIAQSYFSNVQTQVPSVPASPNTRRRAFNFQPISPRSTPTIQEPCFNVHYVTSMGANGTQLSPSHCDVSKQSVGVGPSQPTSANNSPFMSPRSTPVPLVRSRHNSGQSIYSNTRQTPIQSLDSGVSSISSSPFISPQATPVPSINRMRNGSGTLQRSFNRLRHNSGPGGPYSGLAMYPSSRSVSVSPLTSVVESYPKIDERFNFVKNGHHADRYMDTQLKMHQNLTNNSSLPESAISTPISPLSEPLSPNVNYAVGGDQMSNVMNEADNTIRADWQSHSNIGRVLPRHRHMSSPYSLSSESSSQQKCKLDRMRANLDGLNNVTNNRPNNVASFWQTDTFANSKSYPATPMRAHSFSFPASPSKDSNMSVSGQDVMVSGVQSGNNSNWATKSAATLLRDENVNQNVRRNLADLLLMPPVEDDLQTTLEDLRDCDNDFSRFAQELEAMDGAPVEDLA